MACLMMAACKWPLHRAGGRQDLAAAVGGRISRGRPKRRQDAPSNSRPPAAAPLDWCRTRPVARRQFGVARLLAAAASPRCWASLSLGSPPLVLPCVIRANLRAGAAARWRPDPAAIGTRACYQMTAARGGCHLGICGWRAAGAARNLRWAKSISHDPRVRSHHRVRGRDRGRRLGCISMGWPGPACWPARHRPFIALD